MIKGNGINLDYLYKYSVEYLNSRRNDHRIRDWCRQVGLIDEYQQDKWYQKISEDPKIRMYLIRHKDKDNGLVCVGVCGFTDIDHLNQRAEFSCYIFTNEQGNGYATKALQTLFKHGFDDLNLNMIWGETFDGNPAVDLFTKKLGMLLEGTRRNFYYKKGKFLDAHLLSISREEFRNVSLPTAIEFNPYDAHHFCDCASDHLKDYRLSNEDILLKEQKPCKTAAKL